MIMEPDESHIADPNAGLERSIIDEFIRRRGYDPAALQQLPEEVRVRVQAEASMVLRAVAVRSSDS